MSHARIVFVKDTNAIHALADESGEYRLLGNDGAGVPIGAYKITVVKMALADGTIPVGRAFELAREQGKLKSVVPKIYADPASTPLKAELRGGDNRVDLELVKTP